jgi:hypothetical protein
VKSPRTCRGSIVTSLLSGLFALIALGAAFAASRYAHSRAIQRRERVLSDAYAAELMEYLLSVSSDRFQASAAADPQLNRVNLCTRYNVSSGASLTNPVDFAALPVGNALDHTEQRSFRHFRVDIVDIRTQAVRADVCGRKIHEVQLPGRAVAGTTLDLNPGETFQFTVGVTWRSKADSGNALRNTEVVSTSQNL